MPRVKSVIVAGGQTQGAWTVPAKAMDTWFDRDARLYGCLRLVIFYRESPALQVARSTVHPIWITKRGRGSPCRASSCMRNWLGSAHAHRWRYPAASGLGYMYFASVFTELELPPDEPMAENPLPYAIVRQSVSQDRSDPMYAFLSRPVFEREDRRGWPARRDAL